MWQGLQTLWPSEVNKANEGPESWLGQEADCHTEHEVLSPEPQNLCLKAGHGNAHKQCQP